MHPSPKIVRHNKPTEDGKPTRILLYVMAAALLKETLCVHLLMATRIH